jgi:hypothetical protein
VRVKCMMQVAMLNGVCEFCKETVGTTRRCCVSCHRGFCDRCAAVPAGRICQLVRCTSCTLELGSTFNCDGPPSELSVALIAGVQHLQGIVVSSATRKIHQRGWKELENLVRLLEVNIFPCTELLLHQLMVYMLVVRVPPLDAASVRLVLAAISAWHVQAAAALKYANPPISMPNPVRSQETVALSRTMMSFCKHPTVKKLCFTISGFYALVMHGFPANNRYAPHQKLFALLCAFGPLRPGAVANLTVDYTSDGSVVTTSRHSQVRLMPPDMV